MTQEIISFQSVSFQYDSQQEPTLKNLNFSIKKGEKVLVIGASGSGKSTFGNCLNGLIPNIYKGELKGKVTINGNDLAKTNLFDMSFQVSTV